MPALPRLTLSLKLVSADTQIDAITVLEADDKIKTMTPSVTNSIPHYTPSNQHSSATQTSSQQLAGQRFFDRKGQRHCGRKGQGNFGCNA